MVRYFLFTHIFLIKLKINYEDLKRGYILTLLKFGLKKLKVKNTAQ